MRWLAIALLLTASPAMAGYTNVVMNTGGSVSGPTTFSDDVTLSTGDLTLSAGDLTLGLNQKIELDDDLDSYIYCTADDTCWLYAGGSYKLQWSTSGITIGALITAANGVDANFSASDYFRLPNRESATPTEPIACGSGTKGTVAIADDTDDGAATAFCYCGMTNDSTYDWLQTDGTACPFF